LRLNSRSDGSLIVNLDRKRHESEVIAGQVADYVARGGKVEVLPLGVISQDKGLDAHRRANGTLKGGVNTPLFGAVK
jgi:hypothetical protein